MSGPRIDIHTHIFTLPTILSREATFVMSQRLRDKNYSDWLVAGFEKLLDELLDRPRFMDERWLMRTLVEKLLSVSGFRQLLAQGVGNAALTTMVLNRLDDMSLEALLDFLDSLADAKGGNAPGKSVWDIVQTLRASMAPSISHVASDLLKSMDRDDAIVALMMDIYGPSNPERDRLNFLRQIEGHAEAALQHPGRVLPFFGVHPERPDHMELLREAVASKGFVGVKLYPSLGYPVDHPRLLEVYDYCLAQDLPVLLHCGHGGFYRTKAAIGYCDPNHWKKVLVGDRARLRVCFAHFGGWKTLGLDEYKQPGTWGHTIYELLLDPAVPNVYTDLAYHTDQLTDDALHKRYFDNLKNFLARPELEDRILFGTDAWLLRLDMTPEAYWKAWRDATAEADFERIAGLAPRSFLGFPRAAGQPYAMNLRRYVRHLRDHHAAVGAEPAAWLVAAVSEEAEPARPAETFVVDRDAPDWRADQQSVRDTYQFLGQYLTKAQRGRGYRVNGDFRLKKLPYWDPDDPAFRGRCLDLARRFIDFAEQDMDYRTPWRFGSAVDLFTGIFERGDMRFADVAATLDDVIDYGEPGR